jgi:endonuclease/exonuclease/phosphatase family metal-dependent hydrolase
MGHTGKLRAGVSRAAFSLLLLASQLSAGPATTLATDAGALLETGCAAKQQPQAGQPPFPLRIVSYNIRWRGGDDLRRLIELFRSDAEIGRAAVIGLQEVDRNKKRTGNVNTVRLMAEELGMCYAWAAPPSPSPTDGKRQQEVPEEETGVAILSAYPLTDVSRIVLPNEGPNHRRRVALGATLKIGGESLRFYSVHAEIRMSNKERLEQFRAVIDDLEANHAKVERAVVVGDFNTLTGKDVDATSRLFTEAKFQTPFSNRLSTWKTFIIELKLDWVWLRGLTPTAHGIDKKVGLSDHWPLWVTVSMDEVSKAAK